MLKLAQSYLQLPPSMHALVRPGIAPDPKLVLLNEQLAGEIGIDIGSSTGEHWARIFAGNEVPEGAIPFAQAYAGHQFGHFTNLGDGRAISLGEIRAPSGQLFDVQLKGAGRTPYSRRGDGKAALGPMLREYIVSEAMHGLGIKTTRSLAVVTTGDPVFRETVLPGAVLVRLAASHLRVGTFEYAAAINEPETLPALLNYAIARHIQRRLERETPALALLDHVIENQINLVVEWMRVGFIHGVMNTDNMTISGETIDYGPCAFMDGYNAMQTFSSIDENKRYAFSRQPMMAQWNLARFAEALLPLLDRDEQHAIALAQERISAIGDSFQQKWLAMMGRKIGLSNATERDRPLIENLLSWMQERQADYTNTFAALSGEVSAGDSGSGDDEYATWLARWRQRLESGAEPPASVRTTMQIANPVYIPRNHLVEAAIVSASAGDLSPAQALLQALSRPYRENEKFSAFRQPPKQHEMVTATFCGT